MIITLSNGLELTTIRGQILDTAPVVEVLIGRIIKRCADLQVGDTVYLEAAFIHPPSTVKGTIVSINAQFDNYKNDRIQELNADVLKA